VPHFTDKAEAADLILEMGLPYVTLFRPSFYYQNLLDWFPPKKDSMGNLTFTLPETETLTMFDVRDTGYLVANILKDPNAYNKKEINAVGIQGHVDEIFRLIGRSIGKKVILEQITRDKYAKSGGPYSKHIAEMFGWFNDFTYYGPGAEIESGRNVYPSMTTLDTWARSTFMEH